VSGCASAGEIAALVFAGGGDCVATAADRYVHPDLAGTGQTGGKPGDVRDGRLPDSLHLFCDARLQTNHLFLCKKGKALENPLGAARGLSCRAYMEWTRGNNRQARAAFDKANTLSKRMRDEFRRRR
jgi:hypothetical protein